MSKEKGQYFQAKWKEIEYRFANQEMKKEIERLNNIINELEYYIKVELKHCIPTWKLETDYSFGESSIYEFILNKIKELKNIQFRNNIPNLYKKDSDKE